jgi:hypothetical protein
VGGAAAAVALQLEHGGFAYYGGHRNPQLQPSAERWDLASDRV